MNAARTELARPKGSHHLHHAALNMHPGGQRGNVVPLPLQQREESFAVPTVMGVFHQHPLHNRRRLLGVFLAGVPAGYRPRLGSWERGILSLISFNPNRVFQEVNLGHKTETPLTACLLAREICKVLPQGLG